MKLTRLLTTSVAALLLAGCSTTPQLETMEFTNNLTPEEISAAKFTPEVMWKMGRIGGQTLSPDGSHVAFTITYYDMATNKGTTSIYLVAPTGGSVVRLVEGASAPSWSGDSSRLYYVDSADGQVWSIAPDGSDKVQITDVEGLESYGVAPAGNALYYTKRVHVVDINSSAVYADAAESKARIYDDLMVRHWDYWDEGDYSHIFVASLGEGIIKEGKDIMEGEPWDAPMAPYFDSEEIAWNHAGTALAYTCKHLTGADYAVSTDSDIFIYDLATGTTRNICKEWGEMPGYDKYPVWSPNDKMIALRSMRRAGNESDKERLFVWNSEDGTMRDLTPRFDYNATNVVWEGNDTLYFIAPITATHQICRVGLNGTEVEVLTAGDHDINAFTKAGSTIVANMNTIMKAPELYAVGADWTLNQITFVNKQIYDNIPMGECAKRWVRTTDGKQMLTWVILPPDFDESKKYPTLLYCQGGPQSVVSQFWSYRWNFQLMAAQGYVVVAPNRRGLPSFGQEWLDQISGDYSGQNIRDYLAAIDDVAAEPWSDEERLGAVGASYGGYSVYYLAGHHEGRFKALISHCGIFNFESMYGHTEEMWFVNNDYGGAYWDKHNRTAQRSYRNSPHKAVADWDTPILIFTGLKDYRIPYTQSLEAFTAAKLRGVPARLVAFENEAHQVFKPQNSLVWNREFFGWLDKYLK
ncbi:MAG: S9 family peptidase [Tidjanibacter sp.]|nr:S9 family peptidase [Tidjanibacter sp.]